MISFLMLSYPTPLLLPPPLSAHQTHYEQMGVARGVVRVGQEEHAIEVDSMRDHSYGRWGATAK